MIPEKTKTAAKTLLYLYQRTFWYIAQAKNELLKPLGFWNETLLILTFLAVNNQRPGLPVILTAYIIVLFAAAIIGKIIVVMGIVKYNTKISNHQNAELMEILDEIKDLKRIVRTEASEVPMGVSQWREHGKKFGYWEYFEKETNRSNQ